MLSRFLIVFLPRSKLLLISWLQSPSAVILDPPPQNKVSHCFHCFPIIYHEVMGLGAIIFWIFIFWMLSFQPALSRSSSTFIERLFSSSLLSAIRVVSSAYKVVDISPGNLDSSCASSSPAFHMMYSAFKLNKQGDSIQPWCTPFPIWNQSVVPCAVMSGKTP